MSQVQIKDILSQLVDHLKTKNRSSTLQVPGKNSSVLYPVDTAVHDNIMTISLDNITIDAFLVGTIVGEKLSIDISFPSLNRLIKFYEGDINGF